MSYLVWYRSTLNLPLRNSTKVTSIAPDTKCNGIFRVQVASTATAAGATAGAGATAAGAPAAAGGEGGEESSGILYARKVVLATGIQGGGEWHVPSIVRDSVEKQLYAHTCEDIDFAALKGKR
jgi:hypothetical protein